MKKARNILSLILAALMICALVGCGSADGAAKSESASEYYYDGDYASDYGVYEQYDPVENNTPAATGDAEIERKIVRNASMRLECDDARGCHAALVNFANSLGGYESYCREDSNETSSYDRYISISLVIKLPPEKLDEFVSKAGELAKVTYSEITSDEITDKYYDATLRLKTLKQQLNSYYTLLERAETMDDIITIQSRIDELVAEIERLEGTLRYYDSIVDESKVEMTIYQNIDVPVAEDDFEWDSLGGSDVLRLIRNGFLGVLNFLWSLLLWLVIIIISASPLIAIAVPIFFGVRAWRKKHPKKEKPVTTVFYQPLQPVKPQPATPEQKEEDRK